MGAEAEAKDAARSLKSSDALEWLARGGYVATGVVHVLIGVIVFTIVFGGAGDSSQSGAFEAIAGAPLGFVLLWVLAVALWALGLWLVLDGFLARGEAKKKWGRRISAWGRAVVFLALGGIAVAVALGAKPDSTRSAESASRGVLAIPGGVFVLALVGIGVGAAGITFIVIGVRRGFEKKLTLPAGKLGTTVRTLGLVGYIAKGVALTIVGILLLVAAVTVDPGKAGGLDAAISALLALPYGPWLTGAVGVGLIAYGVFCFFRARFAKL